MARRLPVPPPLHLCGYGTANARCVLNPQSQGHGHEFEVTDHGLHMTRVQTSTFSPTCKWSIVETDGASLESLGQTGGMVERGYEDHAFLQG